MDALTLSSSLRSGVSNLHKCLRKQGAAGNSYSMTELETIGLLVQHTALLPTELAAQTHVRAQSMSQILLRLEEQGLVKRTPSKEDRRKVFISLTAAGKKMVEKTLYERDEWLMQVIEQQLTAREKKMLEDILPVLQKLTGKKQNNSKA